MFETRLIWTASTSTALVLTGVPSSGLARSSTLGALTVEAWRQGVASSTCT